MGLQSRGSPGWRDFGTPAWESRLARFRDSHAGVPGEKSHLDVGPVERCRVYYKREGGGFPQVWVVVSLVCPCCPWLVLAPNMLQLCTNHLVWVVCKLVWMSELGCVPRFLPLPLSCTWTHFWILQGIGSVSMKHKFESPPKTKDGHFVFLFCY